MLAKAVDGALQSGVGLVLLLLSPTALNSVILFLMRAELREDPKALLADLFLRAGQSMAHMQIFAGVLLVSHGLIKLVLVAAVARHQRWAYPVAVAVFGGFAVYQSYRIAIHPSAFLWVVTIVDVMVIALIAHEYTTLAPHEPRTAVHD